MSTEAMGSVWSSQAPEAVDTTLLTKKCERTAADDYDGQRPPSTPCQSAEDTATANDANCSAPPVEEGNDVTPTASVDAITVCTSGDASGDKPADTSGDKLAEATDSVKETGIPTTAREQFMSKLRRLEEVCRNFMSMGLDAVDHELLNDVIEDCAATGLCRFPWELMRLCFAIKFQQAFVDFDSLCRFEASSSSSSSSAGSYFTKAIGSYEDINMQVVSRLLEFSHPPICLQRIAELLLGGRNFYRKTGKWLFAVRRNLEGLGYLTSDAVPFPKGSFECQVPAVDPFKDFQPIRYRTNSLLDNSRRNSNYHHDDAMFGPVIVSPVSPPSGCASPFRISVDDDEHEGDEVLFDEESVRGFDRNRDAATDEESGGGSGSTGSACGDSSEESGREVDSVGPAGSSAATAARDTTAAAGDQSSSGADEGRKSPTALRTFSNFFRSSAVEDVRRRFPIRPSLGPPPAMWNNVPPPQNMTGAGAAAVGAGGGPSRGGVAVGGQRRGSVSIGGRRNSPPQCHRPPSLSENVLNRSGGRRHQGGGSGQSSSPPMFSRPVGVYARAVLRDGKRRGAVTRYRRSSIQNVGMMEDGERGRKSGGCEDEDWRDDTADDGDSLLRAEMELGIDNGNGRDHHLPQRRQQWYRDGDLIVDDDDQHRRCCYLNNDEEDDSTSSRSVQPPRKVRRTWTLDRLRRDAEMFDSTGGGWDDTGGSGGGTRQSWTDELVADLEDGDVDDSGGFERQNEMSLSSSPSSGRHRSGARWRSQSPPSSYGGDNRDDRVSYQHIDRGGGLTAEQHHNVERSGGTVHQVL